LPRVFRRQQTAALQASDKVLNFQCAICALNLLILVGMTITVQLVLDQMHPSCPAVLMYLPLLGTVTTLATIALLIVLARTRCGHGWTSARKSRFSLDIFCLVLFVPYMYYWNLIGLHF
jgi:hypothetical protein